MLLHGAPFFQTYPHNLYGCGRAREKNIAVRRNPPPKQNAALRNSGRGTMSLAGAGQSPQSFTASAVSADGAIYSPISKSQTCAPLPSGNQTPPGVTHPSKQNAVLRLTAQRSTRLRRATFPPRTHPRRKAIGADSPRALPSKIPHALCNPPMVFRSSNPCPARSLL